MTMPARSRRTPRPMKAEPPFDLRRPSSRLKKTMNPKENDNSRNEIDDPERTLTKSLRKVMRRHLPSPRSRGEGGAAGAGGGAMPAGWCPSSAAARHLLPASGEKDLHHNGPEIPPSFLTRQK